MRSEGVLYLFASLSVSLFPRFPLRATRQANSGTRRFVAADIDECAENIDNCVENAICTNILGSFLCMCQNGYTEDGHICKGNCSLECDPNASCCSFIQILMSVMRVLIIVTSIILFVSILLAVFSAYVRVATLEMEHFV